MVVDRYRQLFLGSFLANNVLIQIFLEFQRAWQLARRTVALLVAVVFDDGIANGNAFIADIGPWIIAGRGNEFTDDVLALMAERTSKGIVRSGALQAGSPKAHRTVGVRRARCIKKERSKDPLPRSEYCPSPVYQHYPAFTLTKMTDPIRRVPIRTG